jgi:CHAD domain-containing protein
MKQNEAGLRSNLDSEFLHDFRVAVRRTRSALTQLKGVLPPNAVAHFKTEFSWLGQITGPTRDLDVYLLKMPVYRASLPEHLRADLDPLDEFLERHQKIEHRDLVQLLDTQRYRSLLTEWQDFLEQPLSEDADRPEGATPILDLASRRIWRSSRKVLKKGGAIAPGTPAEALHRLRIECKKLRYLLEFFRSLYPEKELLPLINALKRLQDNLGDFNDLEVQQATLKEFAQTMLAEKIGTVKSLMAMGRLVEGLEHRQVEERQIFHKRFARFSNRKNRRRFAILFKPSETGKA